MMTKVHSHEQYVSIYRFLKRVAGRPLCRLLGFSSACYALPQTPALIVSNHNADLDPVFVAMAFQEHMYFVASEHVFRWGLVSRLLVGLFGPIARRKGMADAQSAMQILRALRKGHNVCLFAEGNRSFSGVTGPVFPATGKLARASRAALVTYHIKGGYLCTPRWALTRRHGRMEGELVHVYSPEELRGMTDEEVNAAIAADLYEDAYDRQREEMRPYPGRRLAEGLEYALYLCPRCGGIGSLHGKGDRFTCTCGLEVRYNTFGFFEGEDAPFSAVRDWDAWQEAETARLAARAVAQPEKPVFSDEGQRLLRIEEGHRAVEIASGRLTMTGAALSVGEVSFPLDAVADMALCGRAHIVFTVAGEQYEIRSRPACCGRKYVVLLQKRKELR